jgi:hypothetical protein
MKSYGSTRLEVYWTTDQYANKWYQSVEIIPAVLYLSDTFFK